LDQNYIAEHQDDNPGVKQRDTDELTCADEEISLQTTDQVSGNKVSDVDGKTELLVPRRTRTRIVKPPVHYKS